MASAGVARSVHSRVTRDCGTSLCLVEFRTNVRSVARKLEMMNSIDEVAYASGAPAARRWEYQSIWSNGKIWDDLHHPTKPSVMSSASTRPARAWGDGANGGGELPAHAVHPMAQSQEAPSLETPQSQEAPPSPAKSNSIITTAARRSSTLTRARAERRRATAADAHPARGQSRRTSA